MTNNSRPKRSIQVTIIILSAVTAICMAVVACKPAILPLISKPTPTAIQPTSGPSSRYQPEIIPLPTDTPDLAVTATLVPTNAPTFTPTVTPTYTFITQPLPDLTVTGISDPVCAPEFNRTTLRFTIVVRNIGRARTRSFGKFDVGVFLILGQSSYSLDEWATKFNGVVGTSKMEVSNLNPNRDLKFTVVVDLKGNKEFGIEVIANSGENPIREADTTNNILIKYFSMYCY